MKTLVFNEAKWLKIFSLAMVLLAASCCQPEDDDIMTPTVKSVEVSNVTETSATISGMVSFDGGSRITEQGIYLDETKKVPANYVNGEIVFSVTVSNLTPGTSHSAKAYAVNMAGISYGKSLEFTTLSSLPLLETREATAVTANSAVLNGIILSDNLPDGLTFTFEYGLDESLGSYVSAEVLFNVGNISAQASINSLQAGTTYYYRLKVENSEGETSYSSPAQFVTLSSSFSIPNTEIIQVETDEEGNVYVAGMFVPENIKNDAFVAKFDSDGQLIWRSNIITDNYDMPRGGLISKDGVLYVHMGRDDEYGTSAGKLYVDAYSCESGEMLWSREISDGLGYDLAISDDGFIYSVAYIKITKLSLSGEIVAQFTAQGAYSFDAISIYDDSKLFASGSAVVSEGSQSMIWCFDRDLNMLWDISADISEGMAGFFSIVSFPENNLIFLGESEGVITDGTPMESSVVCYQVQSDTLELKWKKSFDSSIHLRLKREANNFYAYSSDYGVGGMSDNPQGPILMDQEGNILWTANPKINGYMAISGDKMYVASGNSFLTVILI